ncbi:MAG: hypothetical protein KGN78_00810 [Actinomycetales bacterium]|nr:hypothetical protein [Actinomycetales bacterium]
MSIPGCCGRTPTLAERSNELQAKAIGPDLGPGARTAALVLGDFNAHAVRLCTDLQFVWGLAMQHGICGQFRYNLHGILL